MVVGFCLGDKTADVSKSRKPALVLNAKVFRPVALVEVALIGESGAVEGRVMHADNSAGAGKGPVPHLRVSVDRQCLVPELRRLERRRRANHARTNDDRVRRVSHGVASLWIIAQS